MAMLTAHHLQLVRCLAVSKDALSVQCAKDKCVMRFVGSRVGCYDGLGVGPDWEVGDSSVSAAVLDSMKATTMHIGRIDTRHRGGRACLSDQKMASVTALLCRIGTRVQGRIAETTDCEGQCDGSPLGW